MPPAAMGKSKKRGNKRDAFAGDPFFAAPAEQKQKRPKQQETTHAAPRATSEAPRRAPGDAERKRPKQAKPKARPGDADRVVAGFHPRNRYRGSYDFDALVAALPDLASALTTNPRTGARTVDWRSERGVLLLNAAILAADYGVAGLEATLPAGRLVPPVPSRADYVHVVADLLRGDGAGDLAGLLGVDVGTGASAVYPIVGVVDYGFEFVATDVDGGSLAAARALLDRNARVGRRVRLVRQTSGAPHRIFDVLAGLERPAAFTLCNPPFHASADQAAAAASKNAANVGGGGRALAFGGTSHELHCAGGEDAFVAAIVADSKTWTAAAPDAAPVWFTTLVSRKHRLKRLRSLAEAAGAVDVRAVQFGGGGGHGKIAHVLAWSFLAPPARAARLSRRR